MKVGSIKGWKILYNYLKLNFTKYKRILNNYSKKNICNIISNPLLSLYLFYNLYGLT